MSTLRSSVLIVGHPSPDAIAFGADFANTSQAAREALSDFRYPVIALPSSELISEDVLALLEFVNAASPLSQRVIIQNDTSAEGLRRIINTGSVFRILPSFDDPRFDLTIQEALDEYRLLRQNAKLLQLVNEQNDRLRKLTTDLEERVEVRRKSLEEAKERLLVTNHRVEALHRALVAIHRAVSIGEMERLINEALSGALGLTWTRILFQSQSELGLRNPMGPQILAIHTATLTRGKETLGHIYFARDGAHPFTRDENGFLEQIADAVSLAIDRLTKLAQSETLKYQWETTFDAILDPVSLITDDFTVVRINRSFADRSGSEPEKVIGRKCHEALFGRTSPCEGCEIGGKKGSNFRLKPARTSCGDTVIYDVFSQEIQFKAGSGALFVNMYHDVSSQLRYERQILESAKMAELGTIGSSIAHELNNPLGGMLSFLQLIKMDLNDKSVKEAESGESVKHASGEEAWYSDISEMEKGARRCRDIVQSLLGFTRKSQDVLETVDLREIIEQALKITELQTRAMGISVKENLPAEAAEIRGQFNALAQALRNFLQNAQEAIAHRMRSQDRTPGLIEVSLQAFENKYEIEIKDNGIGFGAEVGDLIYDPMYTTKDPVNNPGLGLTVAQQIVRDHGGSLHISSTKGAGTLAKISLPKVSAAF
jgi:two-component system, NtrC family, sensor kinase